MVRRLHARARFPDCAVPPFGRHEFLVGEIDPANETAEVVIAAGAGRLRGILLHKLMEEFLTGELGEDEREVTDRSSVLLGQLVAGATEFGTLPDPTELAATALRTLRLPEIAVLRPRLLPELAVWSNQDGALIAGRADAVAYDGEAPDVVLDWKIGYRALGAGPSAIPRAVAGLHDGHRRAARRGRLYEPRRGGLGLSHLRDNGAALATR